MKLVQSFEYRPGYGAGIESIDRAVNDFIRSLVRKNITDVEIRTFASEKVIIYAVIWNKE